MRTVESWACAPQLSWAADIVQLASEYMEPTAGAVF